MSTVPARDSYGAREAIAGLLATLAIAAAALGVVYRPARIIPFAVILALVAARMTNRYHRLAGVAVAVVVVAWVLGMTIAVLTKNPVF